MKKRFASFVNVLGVLLIPNAFQDRVTVKEKPENNSVEIQVVGIQAQDDVQSLIKSLEQQLGSDLVIKRVTPDEMSLSTQEFDHTNN